MSEQSSVNNPFMLMLNPEIVLAAMEKSERLAGLNRHQCRPLDRVGPGTPKEAGTHGESSAVNEDREEADEVESGASI